MRESQQKSREAAHQASVAIITKAEAEQGAGVASQARGPGAGSGARTAVPVVWRL